jgi:hypothetical protein
MKSLKKGPTINHCLFVNWVLIMLVAIKFIWSLSTSVVSVLSDVPDSEKENDLNPLRNMFTLLNEVHSQYSEGERIPNDAFLPLVSDTRTHVMFFSMSVSIIFREIFGQLYSFSALQLSFVLFLQYFMLGLPVFLGVHLSFSSSLLIAIWSSPLLVLPMRRIHVANTNQHLLSRVAFAAKDQLREAAKQLSVTRSKLQLSDEQLLMAEERASKLFDEKLEFSDKIGIGPFGKVDNNATKRTEVGNAKSIAEQERAALYNRLLMPVSPKRRLQLRNNGVVDEK